MNAVSPELAKTKYRCRRDARDTIDARDARNAQWQSVTDKSEE